MLTLRPTLLSLCHVGAKEIGRSTVSRLFYSPRRKTTCENPNGSVIKMSLICAPLSDLTDSSERGTASQIEAECSRTAAHAATSAAPHSTAAVSIMGYMRQRQAAF